MTETQEDVLVTGDITLAASNSALQISGTVITTVANMILATVPTDAIVISIPVSNSITDDGQDFIFRVSADQVGAVTVALVGAGSINGGVTPIQLVAGGVSVLHIDANPSATPTCTLSGDIYADRTIYGDLHITGDIVIDGTGGGEGGSSNSFATIAVATQSDVVADSATDTLTLVAGSHIGITTVAGTDTITISTTGLEVQALEFIIDNGGVALTTGVKGDIVVPFACTITSATLLADVSGSVVVDIWKDTYANFPPTDADSITASAPPTITAAVKSTDATLTGWTTSVTAGDIIRYNVDSATTITRVTVILGITV